MWLDLILVCVLIRRPRDWRWVHGLSWLVGDFDWIFLLTLNFKLNFWLFSIIWISLDFFLSKIAWNDLFLHTKRCTLLPNTITQFVCYCLFIKFIVVVVTAWQKCSVDMRYRFSMSPLFKRNSRLFDTHQVRTYDSKLCLLFNRMKWTKICFTFHADELQSNLPELSSDNDRFWFWPNFFWILYYNHKNGSFL